MNINEFLLARITEREAGARAAVWVSDDPEWDGVDTWDAVVVRGRRTVGDHEEFAVADVVGPFVKGLSMNGSDPVRVPSVAEHIALNDPARVLAECAAKRKIIELDQQVPTRVLEIELPFPVTTSERRRTTYPSVSRDALWLTTAEYIDIFGTEPPTSPIIAALAGAYSDHPDYDPEWAL